jgi:hypothetical protein
MPSFPQHASLFPLIEHEHYDMSIVVVTMQQKKYILVRCVKFFNLEYIEFCEYTNQLY